MKKATEEKLKGWEDFAAKAADKLGQAIRELPEDLEPYDSALLFARFDTARQLLLSLAVSLQVVRELPKNFVIEDHKVIAK